MSAPTPNRREFLAALGAAGAIAWTTGCKGNTKVDKDPVYQGALPTMEDVDGSLSSLVTGDRVRVVYKPDGAIRGAAEPLVTLVEFSDFQCPFCGAFAQTLEEFLLAYPEDLRLVFMQFPLPMHPNAEGAAKAAIAAQNQGHFWAMHDRMFAQRTKLGRDQLVEMAGDLGLDAKQFEADLDAEATAERLLWEQSIGRRLGVRGTPSFFVNGLSRSGAMDPDALRTMIEDERTVARKLIDAGAERRAVYAHINRAASVAGARPQTGEPAAPSPG
jgi:protein-disulfide isomerase